MFISIVITVILAVCSTIFVHPWFVKGVIQKDLVGNYNKTGFYEGRTAAKLAYTISVLEIAVMLLLGYSLLLAENIRHDYTKILIVLAIMFLFQALNHAGLNYNPRKGKKVLIFFIIACLFAFIPIENSIVNYHLPIENSTIEFYSSKLDNDSNSCEKTSINKTDLISLFKAMIISEPTYSNGKYFFFVKDTAVGNGVIVFCENKLAFYPCKYEANVSTHVISRYPKAEIRYMKILQNDSALLAQYIVLKRSNIFAKPELDFYTFLNLQTGEFNECKELPDFATK
jgi:hypothetical protein